MGLDQPSWTKKYSSLGLDLYGTRLVVVDLWRSTDLTQSNYWKAQSVYVEQPITRKFPSNNMTCRIIIESTEIKMTQGMKNINLTHLKRVFLNLYTSYETMKEGQNNAYRIALFLKIINCLTWTAYTVNHCCSSIALKTTTKNPDNPTIVES